MASLEGSLESPKGNRMRKSQEIKKWKTKGPFKVCDRLSWKPKGYFTVRDCGVEVLGCIFSPVLFKCCICRILQARLVAECLISINLPQCHQDRLSICINSMAKLSEEMLFKANDASNSNRPSRLLMDFNSSYYYIIVFSQQPFVDTILRLQDLYVQAQETAATHL